MLNFEYLNDSIFLKEIDSLKIKNRYAKITLLNWKEEPIKDIEGIVTGGSINIDGSSSMRRTGSLNIFSNSLENNITKTNNLFSINKKIKIYVGVENMTNSYSQHNIIWYPLGIFVISGCSLSRDSNGISMSISFKDKMCLLDGTCGGTLPSSITFNEYEYIDNNGDIIIKNPTIYIIIQELVNHWGGEQLPKIIISDINNRIQKVVKWSGDSELYMYSIGENYNEDTRQTVVTTDLSKIPEEVGEAYKTFNYGDDIGYVYTDFIYTDDLVNNAGDSITSVLDKIVSYLGNYEYFYDINGNFIFQEKKNFLNTSQATTDINKLDSGEVYLLDMNKTKSVYDFSESDLIISYSNTPNYEMIKNDFIIWGKKTTASGETIPIRYHLSIDSKPQIGNTYKIFLYEDTNDGIMKAKVPRVYLDEDEFPENGVSEIFYLSNNSEKIYKWDGKEYKELVDIDLKEIKSTDWRSELYLDGVQNERFSTDSNYYYTELENEWLKLYDIENGEFYEDVLENQSNINYFLDFIDSNAAISEIEISNIGRRTKVLNDDKINCIFEPEIPNIVYINTSDEDYSSLLEECNENRQDYTQVSAEVYSCIYGGGSHNSALSAMRELLYQYTEYNESIVIQTLPIFYLEPNTRITVKDEKTNIDGDYIINSISLSFDTTGVMSINAVKALSRF